ncbi:bile acid:sodium symporter [Candidatus Gracilibacteria bacterium]|nr:bile acid:sodium symporter [Candidatus Gracilibacteria bacterium]
MHRIATFIEHHFWIFFLAGIIGGLIFPQYSESLRFLLQPALMFMLFLLFLKLKLGDIAKSISDYKLMSYLAVLFLLVIPIITYAIFVFIDPTIALGFLLLAAVPPGSSTPALTDLVNGNVVLSMSILIICSLLAPFTIPLLFSYATPAGVSIDAMEMFVTLTTLIFIPLILSYPIKKIFPKKISQSVRYFAAINVVIIFFFVYTAIGTEQKFIMDNFDQVIGQLVLLYIFFGALHVIGYFAGTGRNKADKIAIIVSNSYRNNGMGIVLAATFFSPTIVILMVLSEIPWSTLLGPFKKIVPYLK